jgi:ribosomal RNA-processing protein 8
MFFEVPAWEVGELAVVQKPKGGKRGKSEKANASHENAVETECDTPLSGPTKRRKHFKEAAPAPVPVERKLVHIPDTKSSKSKVESKLSGARFRYLNQKLYESSSSEALAYFEQNPDDFCHYHAGFREQTKVWPINPVDIFIERLGSKLNSDKVVKIADMGCGEAKLASILASNKSATVYSFDLAAVNELVTVASMTNVPLPNSSVDVVIFSLSLMNTDYTMALGEAYRILKPKGELWIAEVSSRLDGPKGLEEFCQSLKIEGFTVSKRDISSSVFIILYAMKGKLPEGLRKQQRSVPTLRPCLYKKR